MQLTEKDLLLATVWCGAVRFTVVRFGTLRFAKACCSTLTSGTRVIKSAEEVRFRYCSVRYCSVRCINFLLTPTVYIHMCTCILYWQNYMYRCTCTCACAHVCVAYTCTCIHVRVNVCVSNTHTVYQHAVCLGHRATHSLLRGLLCTC